MPNAISTLPRPKLIAAFAALLAVALCASLVTAGAAAAKPKPFKPTKGPGGLAFYKPPKLQPNGHGKLIWSRKAGGVVPVAGAKSTRLVLYTSTTPQGKKTAVSGYVAVPKGKAPEGGWPVISWAHGTTGVADVCAPSRNQQGNPAEGYTAYVYPEFQAWVAAGYAVAVTDYQGLGTPGAHSYLVGKAEGRSVLDIVSAARQLDSSIGKRFLIAGHSQGGQSALFAASLAPSWSPDLKLRGTVAFAPASHIVDQAKLLPAFTQPSGLSALAALILTGATTVSPKLAPPKLLSDTALALYPQVDKVCLPQLGQPDSFGGQAPATLIRDGADTTELYKVLTAMNPALKIAGPVVLAQGSADTTVFPFYTDQLNTELQGKGDNVTYTTYPGVDHAGIVAAAEDQTLAFFEQRLPPG